MERGKARCALASGQNKQWSDIINLRPSRSSIWRLRLDSQASALSSGQQCGVRVVGLVGLSVVQRFRLCVVVVTVVGQRWSSGLRRSLRVSDVEQRASVENSSKG